MLLIFSLCILLLDQTAWGIHLSFGRNNDDSSVSPKPQAIEKQYEALFSINEHSKIYNGSTNETEESSRENSQIFSNESIPLTDEINSTQASDNQSLSSTYSTSSVPSSSVIPNTETSTSNFNNESQSQSSVQSSSSVSFAATNEGTVSSRNSSTVTTSEMNATLSTTDDDEAGGVARGKPTTIESISITTSHPQTLYQKTWELISDTYILSILVPVAAGVVFAITIILTIATCRCLRRRCIRRRMRRKTLPDSVKNLRPSDRARLLAESSDEEF